MKLFPTLVAIFLLGSVGSASAFVGAEHKWLSRRAVCVALVHLERAAPDADAEADGRRQRAIDVLSALREGNGQLPDYGQLAAYPDYVTFPNEMVDTSQTGAGRIASVHVQGRIESVFAEYSEMLRNPHHFRELGLSQFHVWHELAIARVLMRSSEGRETDPLFDALAYNAYADHFLQDFFAPGHMIREPDGLSHMGTLRIHDTENWTGRDFQPAATTAEVLAAVLGSSAQERNESASRCFRPEEGITADVVEKVVTAQAIHLQGDNQVYRNKDGIQQGREQQALFVVLMVGRSILDVVESYALSQQQNAFPNRRCPAHGEQSTAASPGDVPEGCYFVEDETDENPSFAGIRLGRYRSQPDAARYPWLWPTLGASMELQKIDGTSRWQTSAEFLFDVPFRRALRAVRLDGDWTRYFSAELGTGYSYINKGSLEPGVGGDYQGHGPDFRIYIRAKQFYMFGAGEVGWRWYSGLGTDSNNLRAAGRLGFGNGIFWAYGSIAFDKRLTADGPRDDDYSFGFGIATTLPSTRLFDWAAGH